MDIYGFHDAQIGVGASSSICLDVERCRFCDEERSVATHLRSIPTVAVVCEDISLSIALPPESLFVYYMQFSATRISSRNPCLHYTPTPAAQRCHQ